MKKDVVNNKGVTLESYRTWEQLTDEQKAQVTFTDGENKDDYESYQLRFNKHNELISIMAYDHAANYEETDPYDIIDAMIIIFGNGKERAQAIKRLEAHTGRKFTVTKKQIKNVLENL